MADGNSSIRFKRADVEFELTASPEDVAKAWSALEEVVVGAFKAAPADPRRGGSGGSNGTSDGTSTRRSMSPRRGAFGIGAGGGSAANIVRARITEAELDDFPELGSDPSALVVGYAILRWARDKLGIEELTAPDINAVAHDRLLIPLAWRPTETRSVHGSGRSTAQTRTPGHSN